MLAELRRHGLRLSVAGDALLVEPKAVLTDALRAIIRAKKAEILRELADEAPKHRPAVVVPVPVTADSNEQARKQR